MSGYEPHGNIEYLHNVARSAGDNVFPDNLLDGAEDNENVRAYRASYPTCPPPRASRGAPHLAVLPPRPPNGRRIRPLPARSELPAAVRRLH